MKYIGIEELETQAFEAAGFEIETDDLGKNDYKSFYQEVMSEVKEVPDYSIGIYDLENGYFLVGLPTVVNEHLDELVIDNAKYHRFEIDMFDNESLNDVLNYIKENNIKCDTDFIIEVMPKMKEDKDKYIIDIYVAV